MYFSNFRVEPHCTYEYDALYRLILATGREHAVQNNFQRDNTPFDQITQIPFPNSPEALQPYIERYAYDEVGNILSMSHSGGDQFRWKRCYQYALDSNRLLATGRPADMPHPPNPEDLCPGHYVATSTLSVPYRYDTHGSMLNLHRSSKEFDLRWDYRDMIRNVNLGGGGQAWYNYDAGKQRTRKYIERLGGAVEERLYLGGMELYRRMGASGGVEEEIETHHLFVGDQRLLLVDDVIETDNYDLGKGVLYKFQYSNHLGSAVIELDGDARIVSYEEYHPYGTTAYCARGAGVRATAKRYRYTGMERDEETGLSCHMARYYMAWIARWVSIDPIGGQGDTNLYCYCDSNPHSYRDPTGRVPITTDYVGATHRTPELFGNWQYRKPVNANIGVNVQQHHPTEVMGRIAQRTAPSGERYYSRSISAAAREETILVETGRGRFHTEVGRAIRGPISREMASGRLTSESEIVDRTIRAHIQTAQQLGEPLDVHATTRAIVSQQGTLHTSARTAVELERAGGPPSTQSDQSIDRAFEDPGGSAPSSSSSFRSEEETAEIASGLSDVDADLDAQGRVRDTPRTRAAQQRGEELLGRTSRAADSPSATGRSPEAPEGAPGSAEGAPRGTAGRVVQAYAAAELGAEFIENGPKGVSDSVEVILVTPFARGPKGVSEMVELAFVLPIYRVYQFLSCAVEFFTPLPRGGPIDVSRMRR